MNSAVLSITFAALLIGGCATQPRYRDAEPAYSLRSEIQKTNISVVVHLESVFSGKRFDEVVCDNVFGVIWNPEESKKIGFTQDIGEVVAKIAPLMIAEASLPKMMRYQRLGSGESFIDMDGTKINSRIMVPFGTYISRNVEKLLLASAQRSVVCFDRECVETNTRHQTVDKLLTVRFTKLRVAEDKPNRLSLAVQGSVTVTDRSGQQRATELKYEIVERRITSEGYFHSDFLNVMNKMANEVGSAIADQIVTTEL